MDRGERTAAGGMNSGIESGVESGEWRVQSGGEWKVE